MGLESIHTPTVNASMEKKSSVKEYTTMVTIDQKLDAKKLDLTPELIKESMKRVLDQYDKRFTTPQLQNVPELKSALDIVKNHQEGFNKVVELWNETLVPYLKKKVEVETSITKMKETQDIINREAQKNPQMANTKRNEFSKLEKTYNNLTKELGSLGDALGPVFEDMTAKLKVLLQSKQKHADIVIAHRKGTRDQIVSWEAPDKMTYRNHLIETKSAKKKMLDISSDKTGNIISKKERNFITQLIAENKINRSESDEKTLEKITYNAAYELLSSEAVDLHNDVFQDKYLNQLKQSLLSDLDAALISADIDILIFQASNAGVMTAPRPTLNRGIDIGNSVNDGTPTFDYGSYQSNLFAPGAKLDDLDNQKKPIVDHNEAIKTFVKQLEIKTDGDVKTKIIATTNALSNEVYNLVTDTISDSTQAAANQLATPENLANSSLKSRILMYTKSIETYYSMLNKIQLFLGEKMTSDNTISQKNILNQLKLQITQLRSDLYVFGVLPLPQDLQDTNKIKDVVKEDIVGSPGEFKEYNFDAIIDKLPKNTAPISLPDYSSSDAKAIRKPTTVQSITFESKNINDGETNSNTLKDTVNQDQQLFIGAYDTELDAVRKFYTNFEAGFEILQSQLSAKGINVPKN